MCTDNAEEGTLLIHLKKKKNPPIQNHREFFQPVSAEQPFNVFIYNSVRLVL